MPAEPEAEPVACLLLPVQPDHAKRMPRSGGNGKGRRWRGASCVVSRVSCLPRFLRQFRSFSGSAAVPVSGRSLRLAGYVRKRPKAGIQPNVR